MVAADDHTVVGFSLSGGEAHDAPEGRKLLEKVQNWQGKRILVMDKAYEGDEMREKAAEYGYCPVVPPKSNRKVPWEYDKILYKRHNEIERYFLRLKRFRRIFTRYDKLDVLYTGFILFAIIIDALYCVNRLWSRALFIEPGSPWKNGYCESFNGKMRNEFLNMERLDNWFEVETLTKMWVKHYNTIRPHSAPTPQTLLAPFRDISCLT